MWKQELTFGYLDIFCVKIVQFELYFLSILKPITKSLLADYGLFHHDHN